MPSHVCNTLDNKNFLEYIPTLLIFLILLSCTMISWTRMCHPTGNWMTGREMGATVLLGVLCWSYAIFLKRRKLDSWRCDLKLASPLVGLLKQVVPIQDRVKTRWMRLKLFNERNFMHFSALRFGKFQQNRWSLWLNLSALLFHRWSRLLRKRF